MYFGALNLKKIVFTNKYLFTDIINKLVIQYYSLNFNNGQILFYIQKSIQNKKIIH